MKKFLFITAAFCFWSYGQPKVRNAEVSSSEETDEDSDLLTPPRITKEEDTIRGSDVWWGSSNERRGTWWGASETSQKWGSQKGMAWWGTEKGKAWWGSETTNTWWSVPTRDDYDVCRVSNNKVETITNVRFTLPSTTCYTILVKECASEQKFIVLLRRLRLNTDEWELKITTPSNSIVLRKVSGYETVQLYLNEKHFDTDDILEISEFGQLVSLVVKDKDFTTVSMPTYGVQLAFDGYNVVMRIAKSTGRQFCGGVCDHRVSENFDPTGDFVDTEINEDIHKKFILTDQCNEG